MVSLTKEAAYMISSCLYKMLWAFLLIIAPSVSLASTGEAPPELNEQETEWLETLRQFRYPEPGHIDSETARIYREILKAPLEEMPPKIRTGYGFAQLAILNSRGDWEGFRALHKRVVNEETWKFSMEDLPLLKEIGAYYSNKVFTRPGGLSVSQAENPDDYGYHHWRINYESREEYLGILEYVYTNADRLDFEAIDMGYSLAAELKRYEDSERGEALRKELDAIPRETVMATSYFGIYGGFYSSEYLLEYHGRPALESWDRYNSGEMERLAMEAWERSQEEIRQKIARGEEVPPATVPDGPNWPTHLPTPVAGPNQRLDPFNPWGPPIDISDGSANSVSNPIAEQRVTTGPLLLIVIAVGAVVALVVGGYFLLRRR